MRTRQLYWRARAYSQGMFGALDNRLKPVYCPWQQRRNKGVYAVDIRAEVGFFAQLNWCVYIFAHCERFGLRPAVSLSSPFYTSRKGDNWLTYHFEGCALPEGQESLSADGVRISRVSTIGHLGMPTNYGEQMTLDDANRLLRKNLNVKKEIQDYVDSFIARHFSSKQVVGVHYRGTDKGAEAPPVTFEDVARTVWAYLRVNPVVEISRRYAAQPGRHRRSYTSGGERKLSQGPRGADQLPAAVQMQGADQDGVLLVWLVERVQSPPAGDSG